MSEKSKRIFTGLVYGVIIILSLLTHWIVFAVVVGVLIYFSLTELIEIFNKQQIFLNKNEVLFFSFLTYLSVLLFNVKNSFLFNFELIWFVFPAILIYALIKRHSFADYVLYFFFLIFYIPIPLGLLVIAEESILRTTYIVLFMFATIWSYDTFAYFVGTRFGKHKLCPKISPKKSWEGLIGGTIITIALYFVFILISNFTPIWKGFIAVCLIIIFATLGDLFESLLKRAAGIKDSGTLFPGHGGVLDRLDSVLFATPIFIIFWYFY